MHSELFFGLLTHDKSRYPREPFIEFFQGFYKYRTPPTSKGIIAISDENPFSLGDVHLIDLALAPLYEQALHRSWQAYLNFKTIPKLNKNNLRIVINCLNYYLKLRKKHFRFSEKQKYARLLNINRGYLNLLEEFAQSDLKWGLIFEDDAGIKSSESLFCALTQVINFVEQSNHPKVFVDVSESFSFEQLGVEHLVEQVDLELFPANILGNRLVATKRPFTNTTCAVLYSQEMASTVLKIVKRYSNSPGKRIIPIDWSFNMALLDLEYQGIEVKSFHLDPGIFSQQSLHP